jgi:hypothetical protein
MARQLPAKQFQAGSTPAGVFGGRLPVQTTSSLDAHVRTTTSSTVSEMHPLLPDSAHSGMRFGCVGAPWRWPRDVGQCRRGVELISRLILLPHHDPVDGLCSNEHGGDRRAFQIRSGEVENPDNYLAQIHMQGRRFHFRSSSTLSARPSRTDSGASGGLGTSWRPYLSRRPQKAQVQNQPGIAHGCRMRYSTRAWLAELRRFPDTGRLWSFL